MKSCYVVMATRYHPSAIIIPSPKCVFFTRKKAEDYCKKHNENNRTSTELYIRRVGLAEGVMK